MQAREHHHTTAQNMVKPQNVATDRPSAVHARIPTDIVTSAPAVRSLL